ncbi:MAG: hypothetical protein QOH64_1941 [Acidimicrobiaceae bacterium]
MVAVAAAGLLALAVIGAVARPRGLAEWVAPAVCVALAVAVGAARGSELSDAGTALAAPLAFLLLALPMATLLDDAGVFTAAAAVAAGSRRAELGLWVLAAVTVALCNLDAAVVLLTPLYVRIARLRGADPLGYALQPALLACLASSALPVSNLTNLVVVADTGVGAGALLAALGPPTLVACTVGWFAWRRCWGSPPRRVDVEVPIDRAPLRLGACTAAYLVVGFTGGAEVGVPAWAVVAVAVLVLSVRARRLPWRAVPVGTAVLAFALAVLAIAAAPAVHLDRLLDGASGVRAAVVGAGLANIASNLPVVVVGLRSLGPDPSTVAVWGLLLGVNAGPTLLVTGSLSGLLWLTTVRREGLDVGAGDYFQAGVRVGLPAFAAAVLVLSFTAG